MHGSAGGDPVALIGPNAVLQTVAAMEARLGRAETRAILDDAQIAALPSGEAMIPEVQALRLHRWLALHEPIGSFGIAEDAGARTADYIIAHRIPRVAAWLLRHLPAALAAPILMAAIRQHAWTFIGAGAFAPRGAWAFTIDRSLAHDPLMPPDSLFHWYAALFARLYQRLVAPGCLCRIVPASVPGADRRDYAITRAITRPAERRTIRSPRLPDHR
ncbi:MAG: bacteriochlorophyll 4-vinyl reductase [Erythrobacter sp.]